MGVAAAQDSDQEIRFCEVDGRRLAFATVGAGPVLVLPAMWIRHLELEWAFPEFRAFVVGLARRRTVVRYDRLGAGLSDRPEGLDVSVDADVRALEALAGALDAPDVSILGISLGGSTTAAFAARHPERVRCVVLVGAFAHGATIAPRPLREALVPTVPAHWGAGSRALSDIWLPGADAHTRDRFAALQRASADAHVAAAVLQAAYDADVHPSWTLRRRDLTSTLGGHPLGTSATDRGRDAVADLREQCPGNPSGSETIVHGPRVSDPRCDRASIDTRNRVAKRHVVRQHR